MLDLQPIVELYDDNGDRAAVVPLESIIVLEGDGTGYAARARVTMNGKAFFLKVDLTPEGLPVDPCDDRRHKGRGCEQRIKVRGRW